MFRQDKITILDGAMGTMLQKSGLKLGERPELLSLSNPDTIKSIHKMYIEAGASLVYANTFGANPLKLKDTGACTDEVVKAAVKIAKEAAKELKDGTAKVALDIGPLGELLEPAGTLKFEDAYENFKETVVAGENAGADVIVLETMTDLYEVKAAVLAAKENTKLPVMVSMTFEENGRTFTGCNVESFAVFANAIGIDAIGINCSLGPDEIYPLAKKLCENTDIPVFVKPNAGLPDPATGEYYIDAKSFANSLRKYADIGVAAVGGCCGTTPEFIKVLNETFKGVTPVITPCKKESKVSTATKVVSINDVRVIGERINPTGKKLMKEALLSGDMGYILKQAVSQVDAGAHILDVNVGAPGVDEKEVLPRVVKAIQSVTDLPLQIDSSDSEAIEAALRVYNGKPIVNSVNGSDEVLERVLPIVKKYGAAVVGLALNEDGIPEEPVDRFKIAEHILDTAVKYEIPKEDVYIDCLTLTVSAQQEGACKTLEALRMVKEKLGLKTVLGVSNISFGLPNRELLNHSFLLMAMESGLDLPIINPNTASMMDAVRAFRVLKNRDKLSAEYIDAYKDMPKTKVVAVTSAATDASASSSGTLSSNIHPLIKAVKDGLGDVARVETIKLLETEDAMTVVNKYLIPALDMVGDMFEKGTLFLPQLLQGATAAQEAFDEVKKVLSKETDESVTKGPIVLATVEGDIHDIGKNIVKVILENYGYNVIDLGRDVPAELVLETAKKTNAPLVGLSALMTTTLKSMEKTIALIKAENLNCKIMVGGAVLTPDYAEKIGADYYAKDAKQSADIAKAVIA